MIALRGRARSASLDGPLRRELWRLVDGPARQPDEATLGDGPAGLRVRHAHHDAAPRGNEIVLPPHLGHLGAGDIIAVSPTGDRVEVMWRPRSRHNSILLTERCDNYCLMCSQPPKRHDDSRLLDRAGELIRMLPADTPELGLTGGEPTVYGDGLLALLRLIHSELPGTEVHLLSNGRRFADAGFTADYARAGNPRLMAGIPLFGPEPALHDFVVQASGAFDQTVTGILRLGELRQRVEIRVVLQKHTAPAVVEIAEFIARNLPFVEKVALMGLEVTGLARANLDDVWVDPFDYRAELAEAALLLKHARVRTQIYNHQLCLLDHRVRRMAVRSISDWKNEHIPACAGCAVREECGGFFVSSRHRRSAHIRPLPSPSADGHHA
ncbi:His-Xaa-Ser system radical SAM maturase HxsC [Actinoplanes sp. L3-i22]|uniref:His-Xaa-Ser system radical SAM maturase HxsC n=1 Tax=Actinoplanes sp. L3-i22 TaxID=2836373 RepID=UPI001C798153|nr:His-Xaa-Ser system radical SAM maturase HxsC [Actinoplanes sp. L3-i22]BCY09923.1 His-Xaa-Ser system radical SAM maturase HxsC [Actinoplanes sp. L3-i22]